MHRLRRRRPIRERLAAALGRRLDALGKQALGYVRRMAVISIVVLLAILALVAAIGAVAHGRDVNSLDPAATWGWQGLTQFYANGNGGFTVKNNAGNFTTATLTSAGDMTFAGGVTVAADGAYAFTGRSRIVASADGAFAVTKNDGTSVWSVSNVGAASVGSLTAAGAATIGTNVTLGATGVLQYSGRSKVTAPGDGQLLVQTAAGVTTLSLDSGFNLSTTSISTTGDIASGAILSGKRATLATGTITTSQPALDISQTWNAGAVAFTAAKINVTDTASAATSLLADFQTGGTSQVRISKTGIEFGPAVEGLKIYRSSSYYLSFGFNGSDVIQINSSGNVMVANKLFIGSSLDTGLSRISAGVLSQVNGANAQEWRVANTTNEHAGIQWFSGVAYFGSDVTSGGTQRAVVFGTAGAANASIRTNSTVRWDCDGSNGHWLPATTDTYDIGSTSLRIRDLSQGRFHYLKETATTPTPVADTAIVYSKDSGGGKTQLMVMFPTGAAQQLSIEP